MLSRNLYKSKKSPLSKRRKNIIIIASVGAAIVFITLGVLRLNSFKPASGAKEEIKIETGDRPIKQNLVVYVNADGGLSLRKDRDPKSERLELIPNQTKLEVSSELDGWYEVTFNNKKGWVAKDYVTTTAPAEDETKSWATFTSTQGYKIKYQPGWRAQDYGANETSKAASVVAFSTQELPTTIPSGTEFVAPIIVTVSTQTLDEIMKSHTSISGVQAEAITVAGQVGTKYTFTSVSSNTQVTDVVMPLAGKTIIFSDGGGYFDDLLKMLNTFTIG